ncbi:hypothetical protein [Methylobacterium brachiatum]|uniref:hypothetical protein n=1 Tax=Methylobacterium brachiatum TaxID=269660 RepID=UPI000EFB8B5A|nr:hypothetical protein [Methylobacterium brachiatum]AYO82541.1 hypothetical protein EBB05_09905 [Methylobacterium brachiatum]
MARRFTVIQGGLSGTTARQPASDRPRPVLVLAWSRDALTVQAAPVLLDADAAAAVDRAIRTRLAALGRATRPAAPVPAVDRPRRPRAIPAENLLGVRPAGWAPPEVALPVVADRMPAVAVVSEDIWGRLSARSGALRSAFLRRVEGFAAGTFGPGAGPVAWRRVRG